MLAGTRCLFQPLPNERNERTVYLIAESSIKVINSWSTEYIVAFFDADEPSPRLAQFIVDNCYIKIIGACSPHIADQIWAGKVSPGAILSMISSTLWTRQELFLTGWVIVCKSGNCIDMLYRMFLAGSDLPYSRLRESTTYFGFNPCICFVASSDPVYQVACIRDIEEKIKDAAQTTSLDSLWCNTWSAKSVSHSIFQMSPRDNRRLSSQATTAAVSPWALTTLLKIYENRQADAPFEFYKIIGRTVLDAGTIRGQIFQAQVLKRLSALKGREQFTIRCLTDSDTFQWTYPGPTENSFSHSSTFPQLLEGAVTQQKSVHLVPQEPDFPAVHSILYTPGYVLTVILVTVETEHPVAVVGLERIISWLKRDCTLANLQPSILGNHWRLIFVVPEQIAPNFQIQKFEGDTDSNEWFGKIDQYVLGIGEDALWGKTSRLSGFS